MFQIVEEDRTKSSLLLRRCRRGRNDKTDQQGAAEGEGEAGVATISTKEDEEGVEEGIKGVKYKEAGQTVGIRVIIKMEEEEDTVEATMLGNKGKEGQDIKGGTKVKDTKVEGGIRGKDTKVEGVNKVKDTKVEGTKEGIRGKDTKVEGIKGRDSLVEVTKGGNKGKKVVTKVTTKMEGDSRSEEEVEGVVEGEDEEGEVGKAEAGVVEGGRILTKEGNLSSSSNMAGSSIARQASGRGFTPAELARDHQEMRFRTRITYRSYKDGWIFENEIL